MDKTSKVELDLLFETSWEVCNKIGGIYAVLSTKARTLQAMYKDKTIFIGPDVWTDEHPSPYFTESQTLLKQWKTKTQFPYGISVRIGRWNVPGKPIVILVKFDGLYAVKDEFYARMWHLYGVDSLHAYGDYDEACAFSHAAAIVIESLARFNGLKNQNIIAHFDEWTTGMGLLAIKASVPEIATIFTTHATSIGRSICGNNKPLYDYFDGYNGDQMAAELNMQSKHSLEKAAAHQADCFTTVSEVTARECEQLLDIRPVVTPNGFEQDFVPGRNKLAAARRTARKRLLDVASALIGEVQPDDSFIMATSGRCEFRNKGIDVFLESCRSMAQANPSYNIIAYIMVPAWLREARHDLHDSLADGTINRLDDPVITHWINNPYTDPILTTIHAMGFSNDPNSRV
ncbi:MAG: glycogen/starch synthase, partial [Muribaculaceae bacterium]|nr:glycogen/starch synthase [Muribaculaceae bacterium]